MVQIILYVKHFAPFEIADMKSNSIKTSKKIKNSENVYKELHNP